MKGFINKLREWASDGGTQVAVPTDAKIDRGWNAGEQPPAPWENWKNNRDEQKVNELIDLHDLNCDNEFGDSIEDRCSGLPNAGAFLNPAKPINRLEFSSPMIVALCRGYNYATESECVFGLSSDTGAVKIKVIQNDSDGTIISESVTTNITGKTPVDMCCDGDNLFILLSGTAPTTDTYIYRVPLGSHYTNGVSVAYDASLLIASCQIETKFKGYGGNGGKRICVADADNVAFIKENSDEIAIVPKALTGYTSGQGNALILPAYMSLGSIQNSGLCSDGTRVWAVWDAELTDGSVYTVSLLSAVLISNPADTTAGLTRDWSVYPVVWLRNEADNVRTVLGLAYDGTGIHVAVNGEADAVHGAFDLVFDTDNEFCYLPRYTIPSGHNEAGWFNGGVTFTGRRVALVSTVCPWENLPSGWVTTNQFQFGLALLEPNRGGVDTHTPLSWGEQAIELSDHHVTALEPNTPAGTIATRVADVVFADDCIWCLVYSFDVGQPTVDANYLIRVPAISRR